MILLVKTASPSSKETAFCSTARKEREGLLETGNDSRGSLAKILCFQKFNSGATRKVHMNQLQARPKDNCSQNDPFHQNTSLPSKSRQYDSPTNDTVYTTQSSDDCTVSSGEKHQNNLEIGHTYDNIFVLKIMYFAGRYSGYIWD